MVSGVRQPTYDDLNVNQWVQGIIQYAVEENNEVVRQNMLKHFVSLMQDCIEFSFPTVRHAHGMILQEMEKGNIDWTQTEKIEKKIRSYNTLRVWQSNGVRTQNESGDKVMLCKLYNKGTSRFDKQAEHSGRGVVYQHYCSNCFTVTGKNTNMQSISVYV